MITINMHAAKTRLSALIRSVEKKGETVRICRHGKPVAEIHALPKKNTDPLALHPELAGKILYDPTEEASAEEWPEDAR